MRRRSVVHSRSVVQHQLLQPGRCLGNVPQPGSGDGRAVEVKGLQLRQVRQLRDACVSDRRAAAEHQLLQLLQPALRIADPQFNLIVGTDCFEVRSMQTAGDSLEEQWGMPPMDQVGMTAHALALHGSQVSVTPANTAASRTDSAK